MTARGSGTAPPPGPADWSVSMSLIITRGSGVPCRHNLGGTTEVDQVHSYNTSVGVFNITLTLPGGRPLPAAAFSGGSDWHVSVPLDPAPHVSDGRKYPKEKECMLTHSS